MNVCTYCGYATRDRLEREHAWPRSWPKCPDDNLVSACRACNCDKGTNNPATWFFVLAERDDAVLGRDETIADRRATAIWGLWEADIRSLHEKVKSMLPAEVTSNAVTMTAPNTPQRSVMVDADVADRLAHLAKRHGQRISTIVALGEILVSRHLADRSRPSDAEWVEQMVAEKLG